MSSPRAAIGIRLLFLATILALPLMFVARETIGETNPGVFQPAFGYPPSDGTRVYRQEPFLLAQDATGLTFQLKGSALGLPDQIDDDMAERMLRTFLRDSARMNSADGRSWLASRLQAAGVQEPVSVTVRWQRVRRDVRSPGSVRMGRISREIEVGPLQDVP